jgi:hypothetical protein
VEDRLVQAQIGDEALELAILLPELTQLAELTEPQGAEALLPPIERLLADAELAADLADRRARPRGASAGAPVACRRRAAGAGQVLEGELAVAADEEGEEPE